MARLAASPRPPRFGLSDQDSPVRGGPVSWLLALIGTVSALGVVAIVVWNAAQGVFALKNDLDAMLQSAGGLVAPVVTAAFGIEPSPQLLQWLAAILPLAVSVVVWSTRFVVRRL